ncbi:prepilin-type N-terminal cleavage/methylation domain-containing protein [bacterium]|nr:MAG: prepilin-type N-terminal cleavage/methylation domain-containing protein [bacterium]
MRQPRAFTLIELLVVIAIIAILAAILFPVFAQAKAAAKKTTAVSNCKQIQIATVMYMTEFDDKLLNRYSASPRTGPVAPYTNENMLWTGNLFPYVKSEGVFLDPAASNAKYSSSWPNRGYLPFGMNATASGWYIMGATPEQDDVRILGTSTFNDVAKTVYYMSTPNGPTEAGWRGYLSQNSAVNTTGLAVSDRHNQGTVLGFLDGHAKWYKTVAILGNPNADYECKDSSFFTGYWWLDKNAAKLKMNLQDPCVPEP